MKAKIISLFSIFCVSILLAPFLLLGTAFEAAALPPRPTAVPTHHPPQIHGGIIELYVEGQLVENM